MMTYQTQRRKLCSRLWATLGLAALLCFQGGVARGQLQDDIDHPDEQAKAALFHSKGLAGIGTPPKQGHAVARTHIQDPQKMKLLVIGIDGTEPSYSAILAFLDQLGIPYDSYLSVNHLNSPSQYPLPVFSGGPGSANYYGIVLTVGNLAYCNASGTCQSTFSTADWAAMDSFTAAFGVRTLSYYTWPEARYGLSYAGAMSPTTAAPANLTIPAAGAPVFSYLKPAAQIPVANAYMYLAAPVAATGETTTPILQVAQNSVNYTVAAIHTAATGQQYLALTMDSNPYLLHSLALNYGVFNWVTKGMFLGGRKIYLSPEVDDVFIADDLFDAAISNCVPPGFLIDPTIDLSSSCPTVRITGSDLKTLNTWQSALIANPQTANFRVTLAFNGLGTSTSGDEPANDTLVPAAKTLAKSFFWISHTYNHENLDCYDAVPNSGVCPPATSAQALTEIQKNVTVAQQLGFGSMFDSKSMITPEVSGLANPNFLTTAYNSGLRYLISDASKTTSTENASNTGVVPPQGVMCYPLTPLGTPCANIGITNALNPNILEVPRFATNIFYNADTSQTNAAGAEVDEYNHFYGPTGVSKQGNGQPFFATDQTYANIIDTESNNLLMNMLRYYAFPSMYHQSNLHVYSGKNSLFTDTLTATINKFEALSTLPIISQNESTIGALLKDRMAYNASGVVAEWTPSGPTGTGTSLGSITLTVTKAATITMTGVVCPVTGATCETYGGQTIAHITLIPNVPVTVVSPQ